VCDPRSLKNEEAMSRVGSQSHRNYYYYYYYYYYEVREIWVGHVECVKTNANTIFGGG
jgi:hypothetical protein